ncbi:PH domain-containing protein [Dyadobacter sp. MSC1_007]|uniref:PH domain-containing protein n=1 Tax=Dyadobacter sp. MSC1_007 TaxID=2909264 RepID=UPI00202FC2DC|nr:PH domain-containing protein [Dyadobacter sp. MSC1_007]
MIYKASWDKSVKIITIGVTILFLAILSMPLVKKDENLVGQFFLGAMIILTYVGVYLFRPVNYKLTSDKLIVHRPFSDVSIDRSLIESVSLLEKGALKFTIRTFGVGGLFGNYGRFYNTHFGKMIWYATRMDRAVLVKTIDGKKIVVTPDDANGFVSQFERDHSLIQ